jgi:hypothetical protein
MLEWRNLRVFLVGMVCGAVLVIAVEIAQSWMEYRSPQDAYIYDSCLASHNANTAACDAFMRNVQRRRTGQPLPIL